MMKSRYAVFVWSRFYPDGGWNDFKGFIDDRDSYKHVIEDCEWYEGGFQVVSMTTGAVVIGGEFNDGEIQIL